MCTASLIAEYVLNEFCCDVFQLLKHIPKLLTVVAQVVGTDQIKQGWYS